MDTLFLPFDSELTDDEREGLNKSASHVSLKTGQVVYDGEHCFGVMAIVKGCFSVNVTSDDGRKITLYKLHEGEFCILSGSCVLHQITFSVQVEAECACEVVRFSPSSFESVMKSNMRVENFVYKEITARFSDIMWAMQQILFRRLDERLAAALWEYADAEGRIFKTQEELAKDTASAREVIGRLLKRFAAESWVEVGRGEIKILNTEAIKNLAYGNG